MPISESPFAMLVEDESTMFQVGQTKTTVTRLVLNRWHRSFGSVLI